MSRRPDRLTHDKVLDALRSFSRPATHHEVAGRLGYYHDTVRHYLIGLMNEGRVERGWYGRRFHYRPATRDMRS